MATDLEFPEDIDLRLNWPLGTSARLARRKRLPHYLLPDGAIRLRWEEVSALVRHVLPKETNLLPKARAVVSRHANAVTA